MAVMCPQLSVRNFNVRAGMCHCQHCLAVWLCESSVDKSVEYYSFSQLLTHKKPKFGTICTTFSSCTNRPTQFGTTSHSLICIRLWLSFFTLWCQLHITLLSKHYTQCSVVAHTSQVKSQSINLQHTNIQISKHSGLLPVMWMRPSGQTGTGGVMPNSFLWRLSRPVYSTVLFSVCTDIKLFLLHICVLFYVWLWKK